MEFLLPAAVAGLRTQPGAFVGRSGVFFLLCGVVCHCEGDEVCEGGEVLPELLCPVGDVVSPVVCASGVSPLWVMDGVEDLVGGEVGEGAGVVEGGVECVHVLLVLGFVVFRGLVVQLLVVFAVESGHDAGVEVAEGGAVSALECVWVFVHGAAAQFA